MFAKPLAHIQQEQVSAIGTHGEGKEDPLQAVSSPLSVLQASPFLHEQTLISAEVWQSYKQQNPRSYKRMLEAIPIEGSTPSHRSGTGCKVAASHYGLSIPGRQKSSSFWTQLTSSTWKWAEWEGNSDLEPGWGGLNQCPYGLGAAAWRVAFAC